MSEPMDEVVERVAKSIYEVLRDDGMVGGNSYVEGADSRMFAEEPPLDLSNVCLDANFDLRCLARAAIAAMPQPFPSIAETPQISDSKEMTGWQTIESAPKDGTLVLGYGKIAGEISRVCDGTDFALIQWGGKGDYPGFEWDVRPTDAYAVWMKPTHWRPLPRPPSQESQN
jgi:hypothetical protein